MSTQIAVPRRRRFIMAAMLAAIALTGAAALQAGPVQAAETTTVNVQLKSHTGSIVDVTANGSASYYAAGGWHEITTKNANNSKMVKVQLAPGTYSFAVTYNGTRQQKQATVAGNAATVYFATSQVNIELQSHSGDTLDLPAAGAASYYAGAWREISAPNPEDARIVQTEMLPGTYSFAATHTGTRQQKKFTVIPMNMNNGANAVQTFGFRTTLVTVDTKAASGHSIGGADVSYYAGSWRTMSDAQAEMLPGTYSFATEALDARVQDKFTVDEMNADDEGAGQTIQIMLPVAIM